MSAKTRLVCYLAAGVLAAVVSFVMVGGPGVEAQLSDLVGPSDRLTGGQIITPGFQHFCVGNRCPGQTCDEVNDRCVGDATLQQAMGEPLIGLGAGEFDRFLEGREQFDRTFTAADGLGPVFNQNSCGSCHNNPLGGSGSITVTRFGKIDVVGTDFIFDPLEEMGGSLLNKEAISAECREIIPVPPTNVASFRLTNSTLGFGLVEAIPDADIEINALAPPAGVSGRATVVPVLEDPGTTHIGRFGWKDQLGTVRSFTADAMHQEMGITNRVFPEDNAPNNDLDLLAACDMVADPEDVPDANGNEFLDLVTDFQRFLAPPPQTPRAGMTGEALFEEIGCADCHMRSFQASDDDELEDAIRGRELYPYTDFLLHDMAGNGDFIEQGQAGLTELRTTPLWGLRVRDPLWHDGRVLGGTFAFRMASVIQQHNAFDSEAQPSAQAFFALSSDEMAQVLAFLDSLGRREFDMNGDGLVDDRDLPTIDFCVAQAGPFVPDDLCAIADPDQSGFVDAADLELLQVALGIVDDDEDDDEDDDGGSGGGGGAVDRPDIDSTGIRAGGLKQISSGQTGEQTPRTSRRSNDRGRLNR